MKLFSRKEDKEKEEDLELPPLKFPDIPKEKPTLYNSEADNIKEAVGNNFNIPVRKPMMQLNEHVEPKHYEEKHHSFSSEQSSIKQGKSLFVKVDKYKDAMNMMHSIRDKVDEAKRILQKLDNLKREEDQELEGWHQDLENIKEKLLIIDKTLFG